MHFRDQKLIKSKKKGNILTRSGKRNSIKFDPEDKEIEYQASDSTTATDNKSKFQKT